jgi:hypothetical protein
VARPRSHGPSISVRLPQAAHEELERRAARKEQSPRAYLIEQLTRTLTAGSAPAPGERVVLMGPRATPARVHAETCTCSMCKPSRG